jgi:hypothetical protein
VYAATDVRNAVLTGVVPLVVLAILEASKVAPRYRTEFSPPIVITTGASAAGDVCALSRRHSVAAARITNDALLLRESAKSMPRCRAAGYQLLYINATVMLSFRTRRSFHCRAGLPANSFSTSTQPRCRCASFAPTAVSPTLPAATWWQVAQPNSSKRCAR